jgi:chaperone required for assembly of F1-ATPase
VLKYINTDLLCYRASEPEELVARQDKIWQPHLEWFSKQYGAEFELTHGLGALKQNGAIHEAIASEIRALDDDRFTLVQMITPACGSIILALAFIKGAASADDLLACAYLEEDYKFDLYNEAIHGGDPLTEKKKAILRRDLEAAAAYKEALD